MNSSPDVSNDSLQGKPVVSLDDGTRVGVVSDLLVDPQKLQLAALVIRSENGLSVLPVKHIRNMGEDAITVDGMASTQSAANSIPGLRPVSEFHGKSIVDSAGTLLGTLHGVEFDAESGKITFLDVREGGVFGIGAHKVQVPIEDICSFGPDLITSKVAAVAPEPANSA